MNKRSVLLLIALIIGVIYLCMQIGNITSHANNITTAEPQTAEQAGEAIGTAIGIIALAVGTICAVIQLAGAGKMSQFHDITNETLKVVGPILFVTALGSVLGKVISSSNMVPYITEHETVLSTMGILFPFLLSAILKTARGSGTVALTTTAGILAPLLPVLGLATPVRAAHCAALPSVPAP